MIASYTMTTVSFWCGLFGYTRQSYYKSLHRHELLVLREEVVIKLVEEYRSKGLKRTGTRKLYHNLKADLVLAGINIGRDTLHQILLDNGLTIRIKRRASKTTITHAWYRKWPDRRQGLKVLASELLWSADITYIRILDGFVYLSLITDEYSKKIVGWCCHESLHTAGCLQALEMALANRKYPDRKLIHHSDRGCQYCSEAYTDRLLAEFIDVSVTQSGSPYDNPMAESMNGQLKVELGLDGTFSHAGAARLGCGKAITLYNDERSHGSLDYLTPSEAYDMTGEQVKRWRKAGSVDKTTHSRTALEAVNLLQVETNNVNYHPVDDF